MSRKPMNLIGWYVEEDEESPHGVRIILVQPHAEEEYVEHAVDSPGELWAAFMAILQDPALPEPAHEVEAAPDGSHDGDALYGFACEQAEGIVTDAAGPLFGRIAGAVMRNPGVGLQFLRRISRNGGRKG